MCRWGMDWFGTLVDLGVTRSAARYWRSLTILAGGKANLGAAWL